MAKPTLARDEAAARAALLDVTGYDIDLDLTTSPSTFVSTSTITFAAREPGASTWVDIVAPQVRSATLNGRALDVSGHDGQRLAVPGLAAQNTLVVVAECAYSRTGEGLHRLVDPVDDEVYLYSQFETADAQRVYACFDQPDLKAVFTLRVTAPDHWQVVSNSPSPTPSPVRDGVACWAFTPTARISTYITALVAGPYHVVRDHYDGPHGTYPLGVFCRASMAPFLDAERILRETKQGFAFFEEAFGHPYPFGKYDQLFVPEYNAGAMENAACVTIMEDYIFRSRVTQAAYEQRANTILHELAHMWFGDLVTMRWWDDLWLNESFAEWASHHAMVAGGTDYPEAWTTFGSLRKTWAYRQDQLPSTHPIATDMVDLEAVKLNFDGITYAKGASALRQLVAWVGEEEFLAGLRTYFGKHQWGNTELRDLLVELEATSGRDLGDWSQEWLRTAGVNLLRPEATYQPDGTYASVVIHQEPPAVPPGLPAVLRSHRIRVGLYELENSRLVRTDALELDVVGPRTELPQLVGRRPPALLLLNDDDLTFAKIRLGPISLGTAVQHLGELDRPMARQLIWGAAWDMARDAEMSTGEYLTLALAGLPAETDIGVVQKVLLQARTAIETYAAPEHVEGYRRRLSAAVHAALLAAEPGSDHQLAYARALIATAGTDEELTLLAGLVEGSAQVPGLRIDTDLRWSILGRLVATGRAGEEQIGAELARDDTASGRRSATAMRAALPTPEGKARAWEAAVSDLALPNALLEATLSGFAIPEHRELVRPYRDPYFAMIRDVWGARSVEMAASVATALYPHLLIEESTLQATEAFLAEDDLPRGLRRIVSESRDGIERALRCRAVDAASEPSA
ncbi:MAG: aminopeptidase N [Candidatus Nanopelagicales bacterium]|nr:aminopeptidase N [Candidatus Nanopelagicales bacterium]